MLRERVSNIIRIPVLCIPAIRRIQTYRCVRVYLRIYFVFSCGREKRKSIMYLLENIWKIHTHTSARARAQTHTHTRIRIIFAVLSSYCSPSHMRVVIRRHNTSCTLTFTRSLSLFFSSYCWQCAKNLLANFCKLANVRDSLCVTLSRGVTNTKATEIMIKKVYCIWSYCDVTVEYKKNIYIHKKDAVFKNCI